MNDTNLTLKISDAVLPYRKRSERMVGYVPYHLHFEVRLYNGVSSKPEKVSILGKTMVKLIGSGVSYYANLARYLGFDFAIDIEQDMFNDELDELIRSQLVNESEVDESLSLTPDGLKYIEEGVLIKTFSHKFEIYLIPRYPDFPYLKECFDENTVPQVKKKSPSKKNKENLSLVQLQHIVEHQASFMQYPENGIELVSADLVNCVEVVRSFYVCFVQSIRDNSVRTIIYDSNTNVVIPQLSNLFDEKIELRDSLLKQCLKNEVQNEEAEEVESGEKTEEQILIEKRILEEAEEKGEEITKDENRDVDERIGMIYDSAEFERELTDIFENHQNEEIWLISPWIKNYAFLGNREPMIRQFLDLGGTVFIGYSKPERKGEEMVDSDSMAIIKRLNANYDKFYYAELPNFHMKNVIEYKNNEASLYTGSFNVLSFCIDGSNTHYRMEQMIFAKKEEAHKRREGYLYQFVERYLNEYMDRMLSSTERVINFSKFNYLKKINFMRDKIEKLENIAKQSNLNVATTSISEENLLSLANKVLASPYNADSYNIQARLASILFLFEYAKKKNDTKLQVDAESELKKLLSRNSIYENCRFTMRRGKEDPKKSIVNILYNGFNFEFRELALPPTSFRAISKHKETIDFKEERFIFAKPKLDEILYNSARVIEDSIT